MIATILFKSYFQLLLLIGLGSIFIFVLGLYFIFKKPANVVEQEQTSDDSDLSAISGDDILSTQLDLARAYIETDKKQLAHVILLYVVEQGSAEQQEEARILLTNI